MKLPCDPKIIKSPADTPGWEVLSLGLGLSMESFGSRLLSAYALGSLAHGGFAVAASDVDLALILDRLDEDVEQRIQRICEQVAATIQTPLSSRLSVFWSSWTTLQDGSAAGRLPLVDRQDLVNHGLCVFGDDRRDCISLPPAERMPRELIAEGAAFMLEKLATVERELLLRAPMKLVRLGCRDVTKAVLFPARFIYTVETGQAVGNPEAASYFAARSPGPVRELVLEAFRWRECGKLDEDDRMRKLLVEGLLPLYQELISKYTQALRRNGQLLLASRMQQWAGRLS